MANDAGRSGLPAILKGLAAAIAVTLPGMAALAVLVVYVHLTDGALTALNQALKLGAIFAGVRAMLKVGSENGLLYGALLGLIYMALGVGLYALFSGQQLPWTAYLSDIAMGVAGGGIAGALISRK